MAAASASSERSLIIVEHKGTKHAIEATRSGPVLPFLRDLARVTGVPVSKQKLLARKGGRFGRNDTWDKFAHDEVGAFVLFGEPGGLDEDSEVPDAAVEQDFSLYNRLPDELLLYVFCCLNERDLVSARGVCRRWRMLASDNAAWRPLALERCIVNKFDPPLDMTVHDAYFSTFSRRCNAAMEWHTHVAECGRIDVYDRLGHPGLLACNDRLIVCAGDNGARAGDVGRVSVYDVSTGAELLADQPVAARPVSALQIGAHSTLLYCGTLGDGLRAWDLARGCVVGHTAEDCRVSGLFLASAQNKLVASYHGRAGLSVLDSATLAPICTLRPLTDTGEVMGADVPEAGVLSCTGEANLVLARLALRPCAQVWDVRAADVICNIGIRNASHDLRGGDMALSGHTVVLGTQAGTAVYDLRSPAHALGVLETAHGLYHAVNVACDFAKVATLHLTSSSDYDYYRVILLWDLSSMELLATLQDERVIVPRGRLKHPSPGFGAGPLRVLHMTDDFILSADAGFIYGYGRGIRVPFSGR